MSRAIGRAIGRIIVNPVVEVLDVDGVVQRVNIEDALSRVDLDALLHRVDLNALLERVDLNYHLDRVDLDRLIERSNLSAIIARSSSGVFDVVLDGARAQLVKADQSFQRLGRCACCRKEKWDLPPTPAAQSMSISEAPSSLRASNFNASTIDVPNKSLKLALDAQGRYCGLLSRIIANIIDSLIILAVFTIVMLLVETLINRIRSARQDYNSFDSEEWVFYPIIYFCWAIFYTAGSLFATGRTIGNAICGMRVIDHRTGSRIGPFQALVRSAFEPVSTLSIIGLLLGWVRRDGRQLHDLLTFTGVTWAWDAKLAYLRQQAIDDEVLEMEDKQNV